MMSLVPALQVTVSLGVYIDHPDHAHSSSSAVHTHHPERLIHGMRPLLTFAPLQSEFGR